MLNDRRDGLGANLSDVAEGDLPSVRCRDE